MTADIYLGTQSWANKNWRGNFYPLNTPAECHLLEYAKRFHAVEIDRSFYAIPRAEAVKHWNEMTPSDFRFTAKFPRAITHRKIVKNAAAEICERCLPRTRADHALRAHRARPCFRKLIFHQGGEICAVVLS